MYFRMFVLDIPDANPELLVSCEPKNIGNKTTNQYIS